MTDENSFVGFDTEFQATPDRSQVWGNFGSNTANSRMESGNLHIMSTKKVNTNMYTKLRTGRSFETEATERASTQYFSLCDIHSEIRFREAWNVF